MGVAHRPILAERFSGKIGDVLCAVGQCLAQIPIRLERSGQQLRSADGQLIRLERCPLESLGQLNQGFVAALLDRFNDGAGLLFNGRIEQTRWRGQLHELIGKFRIRMQDDVHNGLEIRGIAGESQRWEEN